MNETYRIGYMCMTDYYHEIGEGPVCKVYSSIKQIKDEMPCVEECGIVKVRVYLEEAIQESKF
jgi:hypothetical protein